MISDPQIRRPTEMPNTYSLEVEAGILRAKQIGVGLWELNVIRRAPEVCFARQRCVTEFPRDVVEEFLRLGSLGWVCDLIARHCDPNYVLGTIERQLFSYYPSAAFRGKRLLDFGCGSGASTFGMGRMLPASEIVGVELEPRHVELAQKVSKFRNLPNVQVLRSPSPESLPEGIGMFDFVMLSAVYEHLLPHERKQLMPLLWSKLKPNGAIFINQTPHRYFPYEHHSTRLWMINYLPDRLAHKMTTSFTNQRSVDWNDHLRGGIRGATEGEILQTLTRGGDARILRPSTNGLRCRADYWLAGCGPKHRIAKRTVWGVFRLTEVIFNTVPAMNINVVVQKVA